MSLTQCCCSSSISPGPGSLNVKNYGCYSPSYDFDGSHYNLGTVSITKPDSTTTTSGSIILDQVGNYSITSSAPNYFSRSYTFHYESLNGGSYAVNMILCPNRVSIGCGTCFGNAGGVNCTISGSASGSGVTTGFLQYVTLSNTLNMGDSITVLWTLDRFETVSNTYPAIAPYLNPSNNPNIITYGATISCGYSCVGQSANSLTPLPGYHCTASNFDRPYCLYPACDTVLFTTPIGSATFTYPFGNEVIVNYSVQGFICCDHNNSQTQSFPFHLSGNFDGGGIRYNTCQEYDNSPHCTPQGPVTTVGYHCYPSTYWAQICNTTNYQAYCPPGKLAEWDVVGTTYLDGHYTIEEQCGGGDGNVQAQALMEKLFALAPPRKEHEIVIARHKESLDWVADLPYQFTIYDKGDPNSYWAYPRTLLPNTGREAGTYLYHIVQNYYNLANYTYFVQGHPHNRTIDDLVERLQLPYTDTTSLCPEYSPHFPADSVKSKDVIEDFQGYEIRYGLVDPVTPGYSDAARLETKVLWNHFFDCKMPDTFMFGYSASYAVPKHRITDRPLAFWKWCLDQVNETDSQYAGDIASAWSFEMIFYYLFGDAQQYPVVDTNVAKPNLWSMGASFAKAAVTHAMTGFEVATEEVQEERLAICKGCPLWDRSNDSCRSCGCNLRIKRSWQSSVCPVEKW